MNEHSSKQLDDGQKVGGQEAGTIEAAADEVLVDALPDEHTEAISPERMAEHRRMVEAILFASERPLSEHDIAERLPEGVAIAIHVTSLMEEYKTRGVQLALVGKIYVPHR